MRGLLGFLIVVAVAAAPAFADEAVKSDASAPAEAEEEGSLVAAAKAVEDYMGKLPIKFYGHFKLDMSRDSGRTNDGNTAMWVLPQPMGADDEFNITARHTRFGLTYTAPESWGPKALGRLEIDFYGGNAENKANVRLRHAYMKFVWENGIELLAGQTWDLPLPLYMPKLNTAVGWNQGNAAFRRPQVQGAFKGKLGEKEFFKIAIAICDPIARDIDGLGDDDGEDAGVPDLHGRLSFNFKVFDTKKNAEIGLGALYGKREADLKDHDDDYTTWLWGIDIMMPIFDGFDLLFEYYDSEAASSYNASLAQDYNKTLMTEIRAWGAFLNAKWKIDKYWMVCGGYGICDPRDRDLSDGNRSKNTTAWANVRFFITKWAWVGLEYDRMETSYKNADKACDNRIQVSFRLKF